MERRGFSLELEGFNLAGEVYVPRKQPCPTLCLCHGIPRGIPDPSDRGYPLLAESFARAGFLTAIFNFRGTGNSGGNFDMLGWTRDLESVIGYLCTMKEVERENVSLMGFSGGAAVSVCVAAKDRRVSSLILCSCPAQFRVATDRERAQSMIDHFREVGIIRDDDFPVSAEAWLDGFRHLIPIRQIEGISPRPLLMIHGTHDDVVDPRDAWALYEKAGQPKDIVMIEGAGHRLRVEDRAVEAALSWLQAQSRQD
jgi:alpha/beta superfamily hydrolase